MHVSRGFSGGSLATLIAVVIALAAVVALSIASSSEGGSKADTNERQRTGPPRFGFADDFEQHLVAMSDAADLEASIGRLGIPWYFTEWARLDDLYGYFYSYDIRPIITLYVTDPPRFEPGPAPTLPPSVPEPPQQGPQPPNLPPAPPVPDVQNFKPSEFAAQAAYIAQRYPFARIQILNEPNLPQFAAFTVDQTVEVITATARAVHEVAPQMKLIGPASSPDQGRGYAYTRDVYHDLPDDLDYVEAAINVYPGPGHKRALRQVKKAWRTVKGSGRRIWVTEITPGIYEPRRQRCNQIRQAFAYLKRRGAKGILFYRLRQPDVVLNTQGRLWVVNQDGSRTDLYRCLAKISDRLRQRGRPGPPSLNLNVVDRTKLARGTLVRVRFQVTSRPDYGALGQGPKTPAVGALIRFAGERATANRRGRASVTTSVDRARRLRARASRPGHRGDQVTVEIRRAANQKLINSATGRGWRKHPAD